MKFAFNIVPRVLGVDDIAFRRGKKYGTILVDHVRRCTIDLLPGREAETLSQWLKAHPEQEVVTRDRSRADAKGINAEAPDAVQIADRWHLIKNLSEVLEKLLTFMVQVTVELMASLEAARETSN